MRNSGKAIWIMQVVRSTAADPIVDISDISTPKHNIHTGPYGRSTV